MTALETVSDPSCPLCGTNTQVDRDTTGDKHKRHVYFCLTCKTVFTGGDQEWRLMAERREMYVKHKKNVEAG